MNDKVGCAWATSAPGPMSITNATLSAANQAAPICRNFSVTLRRYYYLNT